MSARSTQLAQSVRQRIASRAGALTYAAVRDEVTAETVMVAQAEQRRLVDAVWRELTGAGPLQELLEVAGVTDVLVNGPDQVWIDRGGGLERVEIDLGADEDVRALAVRLAASSGCRLDDAAPTADGQLADGTRLHAVLAPVSDHAAVISLRVPGRHPWRIADLVERSMIPAAWTTVLEDLVAARVGILVSGATGAGKTTLLSALLSEVDQAERIVLIEESKEIQIDHPHVVSLQARRANAEGMGQFAMTRLVKESLRMRPDRIVVGEVRGEEIRELLIAFNTGHDGGIGTIHANAAADVPARLTSLGLLANLSPDVLTDQAAAAISVVIHVTRSGARGHRLRHIAEIGVLAAGHDPDRDGMTGADATNRPHTRSALQVRPALRWDGWSRPQECGALADLRTLIARRDRD